MPSEKETALIDELRTVLSPWLTIDGFLSRATAAERKVGAVFADPRVGDEQAIRRAVKKHGALLALHSPSFLNALGLLREKSKRLLAQGGEKSYDEIRAALRSLLNALETEIAPPRGRGRPRTFSALDGKRARRVETLTHKHGLTEAEAVEQVRREEKTTEAGIKKSQERYRRELSRRSDDK